MKLATGVALDTFGLPVALIVVTLSVALPFLTLPLETPLFVVALPVRVLGLLVLVLTQSGTYLRLSL